MQPLCISDLLAEHVTPFFEVAFCYRTLPLVCARFRRLGAAHSLVDSWSSGLHCLLRAADSAHAATMLRRTRRLRIVMTVQLAFCDAPTLARFSAVALPQLAALQVCVSARV